MFTPILSMINACRPLSSWLFLPAWTACVEISRKNKWWWRHVWRWCGRMVCCCCGRDGRDATFGLGEKTSELRARVRRRRHRGGAVSDQTCGTTTVRRDRQNRKKNNMVVDGPSRLLGIILENCRQVEKYSRAQGKSVKFLPPHAQARGSAGSRGGVGARLPSTLRDLSSIIALFWSYYDYSRVHIVL